MTATTATVKRAGYLEELFRFGGAAEVAVADSSTATQATNEQTSARRIVLTGALTATRTVVLQQRTAGANWTIVNATTGGQSVIVRMPSGGSVTLAPNERTLIEFDGIDLNHGGDSHVAKVFHVDAYGAKHDGVTVDNAAVAAAVAAAKSAGVGSTVQFGDGTYLIDDTITIANVSGLRIRGNGNRTTIRWGGTWVAGQRKPIFSVESCQFVRISDFAVDSPTKRLSRVATFKTVVGGTYVSTRCGMDRVAIMSNGKIDDGIVIGGGNDANNDFHVFRQVTMQGVRRYGIHIPSTATQAYDIACHDVFITGEWFTTTGNVNSGTGVVSGIPADTFSSEDVGMWIEIDGAHPSGGTARVQIASVDSSTQITLNGTTYGSPSGATIRYGAQAGLCADAGNFRARNGAIGLFLDADIVAGIAGSAGHYFSGINSEGSRRLVRAKQYTGGKPLVLDGIRFSGDGVLWSYELGRPYDACTFQNGGPIEIRNCTIGDIGSGLDMRINWQPTGTDYGNWRLAIRGTHVEAATATSAADLFPTKPPTSVDSCAYYDGVSTKRIGSVERDHGSTSGAVTLPLAWESNKVTLTNATTFTFAAMPHGTGSPRLLRVVHTGGPHAITWPTITWVGGVPIISGDDWFVLWTDGTTLWGKQL